MNILPHVFHTGARPISLAEFADAIRNTCPPRFPKARGDIHRQVGLAVSGGVDSMALAYLCAKLRQQDPNVKISDNPISAFQGIVVDHGLRDGSFKEAHDVVDALRDIGIGGHVASLSWTSALGSDYTHPKELPNFESVARRLRYRRIGAICAHRSIASLLLAHQEDDQYETVLMRLLQGHGSRGLRGMKKASDIPECEGLYSAYQSGYVDDQERRFPFYNYNVPKRELKNSRRELRSTISCMMQEEEEREMMAAQERNRSAMGPDEESDYGFEELYRPKRVISLDVRNINVEDGGVTMYRPFLEFGKDRLIATCLENKIPWWEDQTNHDATLTLRNAVRHLYKGHDLPKALQKPAILDLSRRCERRAQAQEAAATRLLSRAIIHEFEPNVGTAVVQFPVLEPLSSRRETISPERRRARVSQQREVAGILIQKILALVSPELQPPPLINLQNVISRLFPSLASLSESAPASPAKAFSIAGIHLIPVETSPRQEELSAAAPCPRQPLNWYLTRTPYPSNLPLPRFRMPYWSIRRQRNAQYYSSNGGITGDSDSDNDNKYPTGTSPQQQKQYWPWSRWLRWELWDNRFWIRLIHHLPYRIIVQPFAKEHAKPLRELLGPEDRTRLAALLKRHAPGKVRYTLPAIYLEEDLDLEDVKLRPDYPSSRTNVNGNLDLDANENGNENKNRNKNDGKEYGQNQDREEEEKDTRGRNSRNASTDPNLKTPDVSKMKLLALPTLDVQIPKLDEWLYYEVRYRRVDRGTLETAGTFHRGSFVSSLRRRQ